MKHKKLLIVSVISLSIILVYFLSYSITFKSMEAMNTNNQINRIIKDISIVRLEAAKIEDQGKASVEYKLFFRLPQKVEIKDIEKNLGFSLKFSGKGAELLGTKSTEILKEFLPQEDERQYMVKFKIDPVLQKPSDVDALLKNSEINVSAVIYNKKSAVKTVEMQ